MKRILAVLCLLSMQAVATANAVAWWTRPWAAALVALIISTLLLFVVGDALPRSVARLAPELSDAALPLARRTLPNAYPTEWRCPRPPARNRHVRPNFDRPPIRAPPTASSRNYCEMRSVPAEQALSRRACTS